MLVGTLMTASGLEVSVAGALGSKVTSAGTRREHSQCRAGSGGEHRGYGGSCTGRDHAST